MPSVHIKSFKFIDIFLIYFIFQDTQNQRLSKNLYILGNNVEPRIMLMIH